MLTQNTAKICFVTVAALLTSMLWPSAASAQTVAPRQWLCDPEYQDCRTDILSYIAQENVEIDVAYWMIDDARYSNALVAAWQRGVRIRLLMDPRCVEQHPACATPNAELAGAGIPMRRRATSGILHWKMILFAGQGQLEFGGANYSPFEMVPTVPYQNYTDEVVFYTDDPSLLHSFMSKFDDMWTSTAEFANYANIAGPLTRSYPAAGQDSQLNFPPDQSYRSAALSAFAAENSAIDVAMFRITDASEADAMIAAVARGVPVRLYTDSSEYRNPARVWDAYNVDRMYEAGVQVRVDGHEGINHEKAMILHGTGTAIFGSSNWTSPSSDSQREHNVFTTQPWIFNWLLDQFTRKWTNRSGTTESQPFAPLPPDHPAYNLPANGARGVAISGVSLSWNAGPWGQLYDIYFGTTPDPPLLKESQALGPSQYSTDYRAFALPPLQAGTTYYWKIVSKTMAYLTASGPVWSFTTGAASSTAEIGPSTSSGACTTADPFTSIGGGVCVKGGWLPSGFPSSTSSGGSIVSGPSPAVTSTPSLGCTTPDPFTSIGGGTCVNGGWIPGGMSPAVSSGSNSSTVGGSASSSPGCTIPDPFTSIGGGVCINGGWIPKG